MAEGDRSLIVMGLTYLALVTFAVALSLFLASRMPRRAPQIRSGVANARLLRAQRSWESGHHVRSAREYALAYRIVAESTVRLYVGDVLFTRANIHIAEGEFQQAFESCLEAVRVMGVYEVEIGISAECPGMGTKAALANG